MHTLTNTVISSILIDTKIKQCNELEYRHKNMGISCVLTISIGCCPRMKVIARHTDWKPAMNARRVSTVG